MSAKQHPSVITRIVQKDEQPAQGSELRVSVESERQARTHPAMLVVCKKDGDELLLSYSLFRCAMQSGGTRWELVFDDYTVVLKGRKLGNRLRDMLRLQRLSFLREGNAAEDDLTPEDEMFIESIEIREKEAA